MDVDKLMKNDELSNLTKRPPCTKENEQNCHCAQCVYQNGIVNSVPNKEILNDEKSLTSLTNSLNEQSQSINGFATTTNSSSSSTKSNFSATKKIANPITSIKNFITSTAAGHNTITATNLANKQNDLQIKQNNNSINSLNAVSCLNHHSNSLVKENGLIKTYQETDLNTLYNDELSDSSNEWYTHCHQNDNSKLLSNKSESANRRLIITTILCAFFLIAGIDY